MHHFPSAIFWQPLNTVGCLTWIRLCTLHRIRLIIRPLGWSVTEMNRIIFLSSTSAPIFTNFGSCHFILNASSNLSLIIITFLIASPKSSNSSFIPHLLNHFVMHRGPNQMRGFCSYWFLYITIVLAIYDHAYSWLLQYMCVLLALWIPQ